MESDSYCEKFYNLDVIILLSYRINSETAIQFRKWSTKILRDFIVKGFVLDENFMKNNSIFENDYFELLAEQIDEIRRSQRTFCEKLTDLYATSFDCNFKSPITHEFYSNVLNKLQYPLLGITSNQSIDLSENQISRIDEVIFYCMIKAYFQAVEKIPMCMKDWAKILNNIVNFIVDNIYDEKEDIGEEDIKKFIIDEFDNFKPCFDGFRANFQELDVESRKIISN